MSPSVSHPIYFEQLSLENVRSFSTLQKLDLLDEKNCPARWTLIVGDNGVGKTTLLQCLARMAPVFNDPPDDPDEGPHPKMVEPALAREENNDVLRALARTGTNKPTRLKARLSVGARLGMPTQRPSHPISTSLEFTRTRNGIAAFEPDGETSKRVKEPLVMGYSASRAPRTTNLDNSITENPIDSLLEIESELCDAEELLCQLDYSSLKGQPRAEQFLNNLKNVLSEILPDISGPEDIKILGPRSPNYNSEKTGVQVRTPSGLVPLNQLGLGYRTVFSWTVDMAWRLLNHYPTSSQPLHQPAIMLVDEIDLHLHPSWQHTIRHHLTKQFPHIQFIATAHSPLMAQSSLGANLAVVRWEGNHAVIENDPAVVDSWRLDQVLTSDLFGFQSARPAHIAILQKRRVELTQKRALSTAESDELSALDKRVAELPTADTQDEQEAMNIIRKAAALLRSE